MVRPLAFVAAVVLAFFASRGTAQPGDPLDLATDPLESPDCRHALAQLETQEGAAAAAPRAAESPAGHSPPPPNPKLQAARQHAASACLAARGDPPRRPQRTLQPPTVVAPVTVAPMPPRPPLPIEALTAAPKPAEPPRFIMSCDTIGCWANDGSRLNRVGPGLWGSRGACTVQGNLLQCPQ